MRRNKNWNWESQIVWLGGGQNKSIQITRLRSMWGHVRSWRTKKIQIVGMTITGFIKIHPVTKKAKQILFYWGHPHEII